MTQLRNKRLLLLKRSAILTQTYISNTLRFKSNSRTFIKHLCVNQWINLLVRRAKGTHWIDMTCNYDSTGPPLNSYSPPQESITTNRKKNKFEALHSSSFSIFQHLHPLRAPITCYLSWVTNVPSTHDTTTLWFPSSKWTLYSTVTTFRSLNISLKKNTEY